MRLVPSAAAAVPSVVAAVPSVVAAVPFAASVLLGQAVLASRRQIRQTGMGGLARRACDVREVYATIDLVQPC